MTKINEMLKETIMEILNEGYERSNEIFEDIDRVYNNCSDEVKKNYYSVLLYILTHFEFDEPTAVRHWELIARRHSDMMTALGRNISIRVSIIDYFTAETKLFKNPLIIELFIYEQTEMKVLVDEMTGLFNFRYLKTALESEWKRSSRYKMNFCVAFIDMDNLKQINDKFGHGIGDKCLKEIAALIKSNKRQEDIACRYGGDEFVLLLPQTPRQGALECVERLRQRIEQEFENTNYPVTISVGIAEYPQDAQDPFGIIETADKALYMAKTGGKNRVCAEYHTADMAESENAGHSRN